MKSLKIVGFVLIAIGIAYAVAGVVQKINESKDFIMSFLVAGGLIMTGMLLLFLFTDRPPEENE